MYVATVLESTSFFAHIAKDLIQQPRFASIVYNRPNAALYNLTLHHAFEWPVYLF